ncbi:MAG: DoxX family protein [Candidatus Acidiferrales bacterium]
MTPSPEARIAPPPARHLRNAISILYWSVGLVVLLESCLFVFSASRAHEFVRSGMPHLIRPILGGAEIIAALLFILPPTRSIGGYALLGIFTFAALIHILHGQPDVGSLVVYAAAVYTVLAARKS